MRIMCERISASLSLAHTFTNFRFLFITIFERVSFLTANFCCCSSILKIMRLRYAHFHEWKSEWETYEWTYEWMSNRTRVNGWITIECWMNAERDEKTATTVTTQSFFFFSRLRFSWATQSITLSLSIAPIDMSLLACRHTLLTRFNLFRSMQCTHVFFSLGKTKKDKQSQHKTAADNKRRVFHVFRCYFFLLAHSISLIIIFRICFFLRFNVDDALCRNGKVWCGGVKSVA